MPKALELLDGMTIGADPELFILNTDTEEFVCPDGLVPGTKDEPYKVDGGAVQQDGFAAEFNIDPCTTYKEFSERVRGVRSQLQAMLPSNMKLMAVPTARFTQDVWDAADDRTKILGCSPDYNAWALTVNPPAKAEDLVRCAGGHLHFGWTDDADQSDESYFKAAIDLVRQLDWYLGGWSVLQDPDMERRKMYGRAGSMRFKPYGVEYRTLSNFWLASPHQLLNIWNRLCKALEMMSENYYPTEYSSFNSTLIKSINNSDTGTTIFKLAEFNTPIRSIA